VNRVKAHGPDVTSYSAGSEGLGTTTTGCPLLLVTLHCVAQGAGPVALEEVPLEGVCFPLAFSCLGIAETSREALFEALWASPIPYLLAHSPTLQLCFLSQERQHSFPVLDGSLGQLQTKWGT
jgi:hypothetical protein